MFAVAAVIAFGLAVILHVIAHNDSKIVTVAEILGWLFIGAHLAWGIAVPWFRRNPPA